ncbi:DUF2637 domain-containing protein [Rhodococcus sp. NPDC056960]|uniref:DUF2637 domain-containing protein n=1 Tax=Rhodococcus sp. NPDC056960 TaxID=3345982 RepID=UPI0036345194
MTDFNLRAAKIQFRSLIVVLVVAIIIATGITTGSFVLSFDALREFGRQNMMRADLAWILPAIIDSAIGFSTMAAVALNKITGHSKGRNFFAGLAAVVVFLSVYMNASHAYQAVVEAERKIAAGIDIGITPNAPWVAALTAIIPPALILACTHGLGILIKAIGSAYNEYSAQIRVAASEVDQEEFFEFREQELASTNHSDLAGADTRYFAGARDDSLDYNAENLQTTELLSSGTRESLADHVEHESDEIPFASSPDALTLDAFLTNADLSDAVKATARMKLADPSLSFEYIGSASSPSVHASTAWRRYDKFESLAHQAGYDVPPLPDVRSDRAKYDEEVRASVVGATS